MIKESCWLFNYHKGGTIYIGIDDDSSIIGLSNADDVQLKVKDRIKNNIMPSILGLLNVMCESHNGKRYIRINIASGPEKLYYILKYGMSPRGCSICIGSSTQPMTQNIIEEMFARRTRNSKWEYNYVAYLLADVNGTSIKVAKYKCAVAL